MLRLLAIALLLATATAGLAQKQIIQLQIQNRDAFMQSKSLEAAQVPTYIDLQFDSLPASLDSAMLAQYLQVHFDAVKYKEQKDKLILKGNGPLATKLKYTLLLNEQTGTLKIDGYESLTFDAWGVWVCTNSTHNPKHTCGEGQRETLHQCHQAHGCVF